MIGTLVRLIFNIIFIIRLSKIEKAKSRDVYYTIKITLLKDTLEEYV